MEKNGVKYLIEAAILPLELSAINYALESKLIYAPGKACNAGGVSCSQFEMAQNASGVHWTEEQVDQQLHQVMRFIHDQCYNTALEYDQKDNYLLGANIAGFKRVADAMLDQGMV
jgi:glutamate dehydrogenase (NADP+)